MSLTISHAAQLTPLDSRLSPIMHQISFPGSELIKVVGKRGRWDEKEVRRRRRRKRRRRKNAQREKLVL